MKESKKNNVHSNCKGQCSCSHPNPRARQPRVKVPLQTAKEFLNAIETVYNELNVGSITSDIAKSRGYILQVGAGILRCTIMELRIDELAEKVARIEGTNGA